MKTYLIVPFAEKDKAKALGARWDMGRKQWYCPDGVDLEPLARWIQGPVSRKAEQAYKKLSEKRK